MFSILLDPTRIHSFNFWLGSNVREGMRHGNELYGLIETFSAKDKLQAYNLAHDLAEQGKTVIVTTGDKCSVWVSLKVNYQMAVLAA